MYKLIITFFVYKQTLFIYIYIYDIIKRYNNSKLVSTVVVFKGHDSECDLQQDIMLFDVSWLKYVRFLVHMQKEESKVNIAGTA